MTALVFIDFAAGVFAVFGGLLAFRQRAIRSWWAERGGSQQGRADDAADPEGVDAVFRMIGVMILAFSITGCAFANLISYYATRSPN